MNRFLKLLFCVAIILSVSGLASAQALGDVARKERTKQKPQAARTYTNEDIPSVDIPKEEPKTAAESTEATAEAKDAAGKDAEKKDGKDKSSAEAKAALNAEWKSKVAADKAAVADIEREINLMEREQRLKGAVYYADAGNRLRDEKQWAEQQKKYQEDLAARQKDLAAAKTRLDASRDAARKAGATGYE